MISLRFDNIETKINFDERYINILQISNKELFKRISYNINKAVKDEIDEVVMFDENKIYNISKEVMVINDFYSIDLNSTKMLKLLYKDIATKYTLEYGYESIQLDIKDVYNSIVDTLNDYDFNFTYKEEIDIIDLIKSLDVKFDREFYDNPYDNLMYLYDVVSNFKICKIIVLINAKLFLNENEIKQMYKQALHKDIKLLLIEYGDEEDILEYESKIYIDEDFDEFEIK